jgi:hypothetical protein
MNLCGLTREEVRLSVLYLKMQTADSFEILVYIYQTTGSQIPRTVKFRRCSRQEKKGEEDVGRDVTRWGFYVLRHCVYLARIRHEQISEDKCLTYAESMHIQR